MLSVPCGRDPMYCSLNTSNGIICYHILTKLSYWQQARDECDGRYQSELASIHSKEESNFIQAMVS